MNVFDLALDSGDEEWFKHLHKLCADFDKKDEKVKQTVETKDSSVNNGIASFTNLPEVNANISTKDMIDHLKYWTVYNILHSLNEDYRNLNPSMSMFEAMELFIRQRREFYLEEAMESEGFEED